MFGLSLGHLVVLLLVVLLFGARRLPELGGSLGRAMKAFRRGLEDKEDKEDPNKELPLDPKSKKGNLDDDR